MNRLNVQIDIGNGGEQKLNKTKYFQENTVVYYFFQSKCNNR